MTLELKPPLPPMEALLVDEIPTGDQWQYEPKWDGFRCIAFRDGDHIEMQSKSCQPLARYFPDVVAQLAALKCSTFVLDGELAIPINDRLSFEDLQLRLHPAASRVNKLAKDHPAIFIVFDILAAEDGKSLVDTRLLKRRPVLEKFAARHFKDDTIRLSPATTSHEQAQNWFKTVGASLDGVIAKRRDLAYRSGERDGMCKIKSIRTVDCVVGGFRYATQERVVGSLLLGLYDDEGKLNHVGYTSGIKATERQNLTRKLEGLSEPPGFSGRAPGGPSRWNTERTGEWEPLKPELVVEVSYDHFTGGRFRHGTRLLRWRGDKAPAQCQMDQLDLTGATASLQLLKG